MKGLLDHLGSARAAIERVGDVMNAAAGWLLILCALLISADVLARDLIGVSLGATLEISSYVLAVSIAWGLARALSERQHVRIDVAVSRAPLRLRQYLHLAALAAMLIWCGFLAYGALALVAESHDFDAHDRSSLGIPMVLPQGAWAFGIAIFLLLLVLLLAEIVTAIVRGQASHVERLMGPRTLQEEAREALDAVSGARPRE